MPRRRTSAQLPHDVTDSRLKIKGSGLPPASSRMVASASAPASTSLPYGQSELRKLLWVPVFGMLSDVLLLEWETPSRREFGKSVEWLPTEEGKR
jgi:hypothetical protein